NPASSELAEDAREESNGLITSVSEAEILDAFHTLPSQEGVFAEPGSCASIAGVFQQVKNGTIPTGSTVVAVLTGNGLKDTKATIDIVTIDPDTLPNDEKGVTDYIEPVVGESHD